jgi:thiol-disulfide isomerase/thioredoxin
MVGELVMKTFNSRAMVKIFAALLSSLLLISCSAPESVDQTQSVEAETGENMPAAESTAAAAGNYIMYESYEAAPGQYAESNVVLFFSAAWCSTCKKARSNFEASVDQIPSDLTVVVVDFDNSSELRKKYGVTLQHTFVQIDSMGEMVKKWSGSTSIEQIVNQTA